MASTGFVAKMVKALAEALVAGKAFKDADKAEAFAQKFYLGGEKSAKKASAEATDAPYKTKAKALEWARAQGIKVPTDISGATKDKVFAWLADPSNLKAVEKPKKGATADDTGKAAAGKNKKGSDLVDQVKGKKAPVFEAVKATPDAPKGFLHLVHKESGVMVLKNSADDSVVAVGKFAKGKRADLDKDALAWCKKNGVAVEEKKASKGKKDAKEEESESDSDGSSSSGSSSESDSDSDGSSSSDESSSDSDSESEEPKEKAKKGEKADKSEKADKGKKDAKKDESSSSEDSSSSDESSSSSDEE